MRAVIFRLEVTPKCRGTSLSWPAGSSSWPKHQGPIGPGGFVSRGGRFPATPGTSCPATFTSKYTREGGRVPETKRKGTPAAPGMAFEYK